MPTNIRKRILEITNFNIEKTAIRIDQDDLMTHLAGNNTEMDQHTLELSNTMVLECQKIMEPKGSYISLEAQATGSPKEISVRGNMFSTGHTIVKMLEKSLQYYFFIATAGPGPEELARTLINDGKYLEGYICDLIGSALAEAAALYVHDQIRGKAESIGYKITNRYSPGYCGWKVDEQQKLFGLFPDGICGISLSESSLMLPVKSISGMVGAGTNVQFRDYTCEICSMKNCTFRLTRSTSRT